MFMCIHDVCSCVYMCCLSLVTLHLANKSNAVDERTDEDLVDSEQDNNAAVDPDGLVISAEEQEAVHFEVITLTW